MPTITQSDKSSNSTSSPGLTLRDEFLPYVDFDSVKFQLDDSKPDGEEVRSVDADSKDRVELSEYLDTEYRGHDGTKGISVLTTTETTFKIPFQLVKGCQDSDDEDGLLKFSLDENEENVKILNPKTEIKAAYGDAIEVEIEINTEENTEFYLDFFANDDTDDEWSEGELEDQFVGRVKVRFEYQKPCSCNDNDWPSVATLVSESEKVLYGSELNWTDNPECYHYALQQMRDLGYWVKTERWNKKWDGTKELNEHIFQLHLDEDVAGMKKGAQEEMFEKSLIYLKEAMKSKIPVMVGLDYHDGYANDDLITDHFAVITGCGKDKDGKLYFDVTDNAFDYQKYYCNCANFEIKSADGEILISQVRISKKL